MCTIHLPFPFSPQCTRVFYGKLTVVTMLKNVHSFSSIFSSSEFTDNREHCLYQSKLVLLFFIYFFSYASSVSRRFLCTLHYYLILYFNYCGKIDLIVRSREHGLVVWFYICMYSILLTSNY